MILKLIFPAAALAVCCSGCAFARIPTPCGNAYVASVFKSPEIPKVVITGAGGESWTLEGYRGAVNAAALGETIGAAAKTMIAK